MAKNNTAIIYFHGMGEQARYEGVSQLVDALKTYSWNLQPDRAKPLIVTNARLEKSHEPRIESDVTYLETHYHKTGEKPVYHFYEVYWAPLTAGGISIRALATFWGRLVLTPFEVMVRSPWRIRQRLRIAALYGYWMRKGIKKYREWDLSDLLDAYDDFDSHRARKLFPKGSFKDFQRHIPKRLAKIRRDKNEPPPDPRRVLRLARDWRGAYSSSETMRQFVIFTVDLVIMIITMIAFRYRLGSILLGNLDVSNVLGDEIPSFPSDYLPLTIMNGTTLTILIFGILRFMRLNLGDFLMWTTHEETDKKFETRKKILEQGRSLLMHVLQHPDTVRVVIVSHGLGSAIAVDSLLEVGRHNRARTGKNEQPLPLHKIDHLITMGSPIDKIHYFFESRGAAKSRTYVRTVEGLRGDIGWIPFGEGDVPYIHWINFWDQGDFISGALYTPANREQPHLRVDNVHVTNYWFPDPPTSHFGYFKNKTVLRYLFNIIFDQQYSFKHVPLNERNQPDYDSVMIGPGKFLRQTKIFVWLMLSLPWLIYFSIIFTMAKVSSSLSNGLYFLSFLNAAILVFSWGVSKLRGHIDPADPDE